MSQKNHFALAAVTQIRQVAELEGHEVVMLENYKSVSEFIGAVADADALIVRSDIVNSDVINAAGKLKIVVRAGAGYDNLDLQACTAHHIVAMNTPGQNSNAVAELAFEMMLYNARMGFSGKTGTELRGKTLGLHGFGNVGKYMAEIARGFGMENYAYDPYIGDADQLRQQPEGKSAEAPGNSIQHASMYRSIFLQMKRQRNLSGMIC